MYLVCARTLANYHLTRLEYNDCLWLCIKKWKKKNKLVCHTVWCLLRDGNWLMAPWANYVIDQTSGVTLRRVNAWQHLQFAHHHHPHRRRQRCYSHHRRCSNGDVASTEWDALNRWCRHVVAVPLPLRIPLPSIGAGQAQRRPSHSLPPSRRSQCVRQSIAPCTIVAHPRDSLVASALEYHSVNLNDIDIESGLPSRTNTHLIAHHNEGEPVRFNIRIVDELVAPQF